MTEDRNIDTRRIPPINDEDEAPTEPIFDLPSFAEEEPPPLPPVIMPPPAARMPIESADHPVDPAYDRRRGGVAALALAMLLTGLFVGYLAFTLTAAKQLSNSQPQVKVSTKTQTATATATATATKTEVKTPPPQIIETTKPPKPTKTVTEKVKVPGRPKIVENNTTPQSCMAALNAADRYLRHARQGRGHGHGNDGALASARADYRYWSDRCRGFRD